MLSNKKESPEKSEKILTVSKFVGTIWKEEVGAF
jgi:hypothetical protein